MNVSIPWNYWTLTDSPRWNWSVWSRDHAGNDVNGPSPSSNTHQCHLRLFRPSLWKQIMQCNVGFLKSHISWWKNTQPQIRCFSIFPESVLNLRIGSRVRAAARPLTSSWPWCLRHQTSKDLCPTSQILSRRILHRMINSVAEPTLSIRTSHIISTMKIMIVSFHPASWGRNLPPIEAKIGIDLQWTSGKGQIEEGL